MARKKLIPQKRSDSTEETGQERVVVPKDAELYINREHSMLEFFRRVLEEAQDPGNPLLERVKFLSIVGSNLAEFFMVRVAGLKQQIEAGVMELSLDGLTPMEQLQKIRVVSLQLMHDARACLQEINTALEKAGIHIVDHTALDEAQKSSLEDYFDEVVFPVLTPLAYDPGRPFPHISNMSLNLAVVIRDAQGNERFARLKVPNSLPRLLPIPISTAAAIQDSAAPQHHYFIWIEQVIAAHLPSLFPGMEIVESHPFRVTRDAEVAIQELEAEDLLETIERGVRQRRFGSVVRLTIDQGMPSAISDLLAENLYLDPRDIYTLEPPLGMSDLIGLCSLDRRELKYPPLIPTLPSGLEEGGDIFAAIRQQDILLHHPYDAFAPVVEFLQAAARDPQVLAIKQTLYRVGRNSPVVEALLEAVEHGKQVAVLVELKARFDEESNIVWARQLESEGVHVVYGLLGLKTHSKIALVVRKEADRIRRYVHLSTGNYNPSTAQVYTDLGLFTCDDDMCADASDLFNYLTGYSAKQNYRKFLVAPVTMRDGLQALIQREIECHKKGGKGHLIFKLNSLVDRQIIHLLYEASQAGVRVDLLVRGMCSLRPNLPAVSDNISVISVVGRFLEHSRIFYFHNGGREEIYIGSADIMPRNLDRRVEILFPIENPKFVRHLRDEVLAVYLADNRKARRMRPDGSYQRYQVLPGEEVIDSQERLIQKRRM